MTDDIAVIGIGCRYPGAEDRAAFWTLMSSGRDGVSDFPLSRFDVDELGLPSGCAGIVTGIENFDAAFFGITAREAERMDPLQRLLLETGWEALEDGGQVADDLRGTRTGVFVGASASDYEALQYHACDPATIDHYVYMGGRSTLAQRMSRCLDLRGPSLSIDTACSSSLVAVHLACQSLQTGEADLAFAAGVSVILTPDRSLVYARAHMLSPHGRCMAFDARASGWVRSDGAGVVLLKPMSRALRDRDPIAAVIVGSAVNNDGCASENGMRPAVDGLQDVIRRAHRTARVRPGEVAYVECHASGSPVADAAEIAALHAVLGNDRSRIRPCAIGSVKTNIGHCEAGAGIASLIKVVLAIEHGLIPPTIHYSEPHPNLHLDNGVLRVQKELAPWPAGRRISGVTAFGLGGTNAHVVLAAGPTAEASQVPAARRPRAAQRSRVLLPLSARSPEALRGLADIYAVWLERESGGATLEDIAFTLCARRTHHLYRAAWVAASKEEWREYLCRFEVPDSAERQSLQAAPPSVIFVCPDETVCESTSDMLATRFDVFRQARDAARSACALHGPLTGVTNVRAGTFATQFALAQLLCSLGVRPKTAFGSGTGQAVAAAIRGLQPLPEAAARLGIGKYSPLVALNDIAASCVTDQLLLVIGEECSASALRNLVSNLNVCVLPLFASPRGEGDDWSSLLAGIATLYTRRVCIDWGALQPDGDGSRLRLPPYPWRRERHWRAEATWRSWRLAPEKEPASDALPGDGAILAEELSSDQLHDLTLTYVREQASSALRLAPAAAAGLDVDTPLVHLGLDSLMTVQLRNRLGADLGVNLHAALQLGNATLRDLTAAVIAELRRERAADDPGAANRVSPNSTATAIPASAHAPGLSERP